MSTRREDLGPTFKVVESAKDRLQLEKEIITTYELIDAQGRYFRYVPETATRPLGELFGRILTKAAGSIQCARIALEHGFC